MIILKPKQAFPFVLVIVAAAAMYVVQFRFNEFYVGTYMDDANYIILAESIVQGQGYRQINDPAAPLETRYPPGYPAVLAPIILLGYDNLDLLKLPSVIATVMAVWLSCRHYKSRRAGHRQTLVALVLLAFNPLIVGHSVAIMSEAIFLVVLLAATLTIDHTVRSTERTAVKWPLLAAFLAAACALIRTSGWLLLPAGALSLGVRCRWRGLLVFTTVFAALMLPWTFQNFLVSGKLFSADYEAQLAWKSPVDHTVQPLTPGFLVGRAVGNLNTYASRDLPEVLVPGIGSSRIGRILSNWGLEAVPLILGSLLSAIIIFGLVKQWRTEGLRSLDWFAVLSGGLLLIWPFIGGRFIHPLIPLLSLSLVYGLEMLAVQGLRVCFRHRCATRKYAERVVLISLILLTTLYLGRDAQMILNPLTSRTTNLAAGSDYIRQNAPEDAIVMAPHPMAWYVHLHRKTVSYPSSQITGEEILTHIAREGVAYILIAPRLATPRPEALEPYVANVLAPLLQERTDRFWQVFNDPSNLVTIYRVLEQ